MKKLLQSLFILMFIAGAAMAQDRTITGTVTDKEDKQPLPGVSVRIKGVQGGTQSAGDGRFSLKVSKDASTLEFSYLGYLPKTVQIGTENVVNVVLEVDSKQLSEVVVVGYSTTTKKSFTGSAKVVSGAELEKKSVDNISQALAGEVSGVRVINTSGQPGTEATIRIRGFGSVSGNRDPLYVVDGVPFTGSLNAINMADVESTTVLKDAAATAIYGSRGANGVVLITTRSGKGKKSFIEVDGNFGTNRSVIPRYDVIKSPEQFITLGWEAIYNQGVGVGSADPVAYANSRLFSSSGITANYNMWNVANGAELIDPVTRQIRAGVTRKYDPENWEDYAFQNSSRNEVNVKLGGSSDKSNYYTSLGYLNDKGYAIKSSFERLSARLNVNHEVKPWLKGAMNIGFANSKRNFGGQTEDSGSIFWFMDNIPSIYPLFLRDAKGIKVADPIFGGDQYDYGTGRRFGALTNAIADTKYDTNRDDRNELNGNVSLNAQIIKGLTFENSFGLQYYNNGYVNRNNKFYGSSASQNGSIFLRRTDLTSTNLLNLLRFRKVFGDHSFEALAAHESSHYKMGYLSASRYGLVQNDSEDLNNGTVSNPSGSYSNTYNLESYFSQVTYDYKGKYFLSGSVRRDGTSRFVKNKWGTFGSVGGAWLVSSEDFMQSQTIFSSLKLKASYGLIGDQQGVGFYPGYDLFNVDNVNDQPGFSYDTKGNPDLTWETSKMFQTGVEFTVGKYLTGSIDYYVKNTDDLIFEKRVGPSIGYSIVKVNGGKLRNSGIEFDFTGHIVDNKNFRLNLGINGEIMSNKLTAMPIDDATGLQKSIDVSGNYGWATGHSIYDFYLRKFAGVDPLDGKSTWEAYYLDINGNGKPDGGVLESELGEHIGSLESFLAANPDKRDLLKKTTTKTYTNATQQYDGRSAIPAVRGAINLSAGYKGFDLSVQVLYSLGGYAYDGAYAALMNNGLIGGNNWHKDILNRWQNPGDVTDVPRLSNNQDVSVNAASSRFITKANYLALNNVRLGYTVPTAFTNKLGISGLGLWISADNLYIASARKGFYPSTSEAGSSSTYRYAPLTTISAGLKVKI